MCKHTLKRIFRIAKVRRRIPQKKAISGFVRRRSVEKREFPTKLRTEEIRKVRTQAVSRLAITNHTKPPLLLRSAPLKFFQ